MADGSAHSDAENTSSGDPFVSGPERGTPVVDVELNEPPAADREERESRNIVRERAEARQFVVESDREAVIDHETPDPEMQMRLRNAREFARREAAHIENFSGAACIGTVAAVTLSEAYVHVGMGSYVRVPVDRTQAETIHEGRMVRVDVDGRVSDAEEHSRSLERGRARGR